MDNRYANSCGCDTPSMPMRGSGKSLAMAYVPWQKWENVMDGCNGLKNGTIFEDLVLSFEGAKAACSSFARNTSNNNNNNYYRRGMR
ncbi:MAG: spore coat associated protein CotJA [Roseburia sp.]|nr:spore coat associated protein CotJA [Roseburia sp.]